MTSEYQLCKINRSDMKTDKLLLVLCISVVLAITKISEVEAFNPCTRSCCPEIQRCDCCNDCDTVKPHVVVEKQSCCCDTTEIVNQTSSTTAPIVKPSTSSQTAQIKIEETISNTNKVHVPIVISNVNINTIVGKTSSVTSIPILSSTINVLPTIVTDTANPIPSSTSNSCCNVFVPCLSGGGKCQTHYRTCSDICVNQQMYLPINPCARNQCFRNNFYNRYVCSSFMYYPYISCGYRQIDCTGCNDDFYRDFGTYSRCSGCFHY